MDSPKTQVRAKWDDDTRSEFIDMAAHELRSLITVVYTGTHLLRAGAAVDEESGKEILDDIEQASERMQRAVEGLAALARLEMGAGPAVGSVDLQGSLSRLVGAFRERRKQRDVTLTVDEGLPALTAVPAWVELAVRNMLAAADELALEEEPLELRASRWGEGVRLVLTAMVEPGPSAQLTADSFSGVKGSPGQRRRIGPSVCRVLFGVQGGSVKGSVGEGGRLEIEAELRG